jgi:hypothetical protein
MHAFVLSLDNVAFTCGGAKQSRQVQGVVGRSRCAAGNISK